MLIYEFDVMQAGRKNRAHLSFTCPESSQLINERQERARQEDETTQLDNDFKWKYDTFRIRLRV